jgi:hypothetical protein
MIDYLEQLERDLVEAVDRRDTAPATRRPWRARRWRGRDWAPAVTTAVALLVIALALALVEQTASPPDVEQGQPRPVIPLRLTQDLTRIDPGTLRARARGPGGVGTLTIGAGPSVIVSPCCEKPPRPAPGASRMPFAWTSTRGSLGGCIENTISRTADGRLVLYGFGRITAATGALRRYRGLDLRIAGAVQPSLLDHARTEHRTPVPPGTRLPPVAPTSC